MREVQPGYIPGAPPAFLVVADFCRDDNKKLNLHMIEMDLPRYDMPLRRDVATGDVQVYDPLRLKWVKLTPEEDVRQRFTAFMANNLGYPATLMANEVGLRLNSTLKRCDTVVYGRDRRPVMIVEYKAPSVRLTQKVFEQIVRYNMVLRVPYLTVSNGVSHYCFLVDYESKRCEPLSSFPSAESLFIR